MKLLTVTELSEYFKVSKDTIYVMVREEQIPFIKVRRRILFHHDVIEEWIKNSMKSERKSNSEM